MLKSPIISTLPDRISQYSRNSGNCSKKHGIGEYVLFVWRWAVNTKEIVPLIVKGEGQLCDLKTLVVNAE